jgi:hypothetical protein
MKLKDRILTKTRRASSGQTLSEYSIILLSVGIAAFSAYAGLGAGVKAFASNVVAFIAAAAAAL